MKKIKKSLAVLLAVLMLASFTPLFASAATALTAARCVLVEAPKLSYKGGEATSNLTVTGGASQADIAIVGGKISYNGTEIEGSFMWTSSATGTPSTTALAVGEVAVRLYFHPTDTTNYSRGIWTSTTSRPLEGWPTLYVDGLDATIVEAPTVGADLLSGYALSTVPLSGGKVTDSEGNDITANGKWTFVNANTVVTESGSQEVQWKAAGYDVQKTTVNVNVTFITAVFAEAPTISYSLTPGAYLSSAYVKSGTGKVVDESGNDITANGKWAIDKEAFDNNIRVADETTVPVKWTATGYSVVKAEMVVTVSKPAGYENYTIKAIPSIKNDTAVYEAGRTWAKTVELVSGSVIDNATNEEVPGTWTFRINGSTSSIETQVANAATRAYVLIPQFIPADTALETLEFGSYSFTVTKADFTLTADSELVLNYGTAHKTPYYGKDLRYSTLKTEPEEAVVYSVYWDKSLFDPATADYGSVTYVEVTVNPEHPSYNKVKVTVPVRIQNYIYDQAGSWYDSYGSQIGFGKYTDAKDEGIYTFYCDFTNTRLKGDLVLFINDEEAIRVSPDENGKFVHEEAWQAPADGEYNYRIEYIPSDADTATVSYPVAKEGVLDVDILEKYTVKVVVAGVTVIEEIVKEGGSFGFSANNVMNADQIDQFDHWKVTDGNGNEYTPESTNDLSTASLSITNIGCDTTITAMTAFGEMGGSEAEVMFGSLWSFWQKLVDWLVSLYRTIVELLIPTVETF